jgi:hypothetical protein
MIIVETDLTIIDGLLSIQEKINELSKSVETLELPLNVGQDILRRAIISDLAMCSYRLGLISALELKKAEK